MAHLGSPDGAGHQPTQAQPAVPYAQQGYGVPQQPQPVQDQTGFPTSGFGGQGFGQPDQGDGQRAPAYAHPPGFVPQQAGYVAPPPMAAPPMTSAPPVSGAPSYPTGQFGA